MPCVILTVRSNSVPRLKTSPALFTAIPLLPRPCRKRPCSPRKCVRSAPPDRLNRQHHRPVAENFPLLGHENNGNMWIGYAGDSDKDDLGHTVKRQSKPRHDKVRGNSQQNSHYCHRYGANISFDKGPCRRLDRITLGNVKQVPNGMQKRKIDGKGQQRR